jgi:hypothetical protein
MPETIPRDRALGKAESLGMGNKEVRMGTDTERCRRLKEGE